jgi:hypothetical protein
MGKELKGLYVEGVAIHDGPESCVGVREGVGEVLTGVRAGWASEPRNSCIRGADAVQVAEGNTAASVFASWRGPRGVREPVHARDLSMRENREVPWSPACGDGWAGRAGKAEAVIP